MSYLKSFPFTKLDLSFMKKQIEFRPLFDADGKPIINWNGTGAIYDAKGVQIWDGTGLSTVDAIQQFGISFPTYTSSAGLRNIDGLYNNLFNTTWGNTDLPFMQRTQVIFDNYVKPLESIDPNAYYALKFATMPNPALADYTKRGDNLATPDVDETHAVQNVVDYTPRMISRTITTGDVTFETEVGGTHLVKDANGYTSVADYGMLESMGQQDAQRALQVNGDIGPNGFVADTNPATNGNNEWFIGGVNPGVAPVNGWFVLFGQFFDHGLDFVGKGTDGTKITINLAEDDPMYGVIDPTTGQPTTKIVITRADVSGFTADGTAQWVNHTSPFIDQSQTYGSHEQLTNLLREWVLNDPSNPSGGYRMGATMLDGHTSAEWTDAFGNVTDRTLPTLNELRAHLLATGRDDLSWEDVANLRNRDAGGHVIDSDAITVGVQATGSGSALLLDSNPRFNATHLLDGDATQDAAVNAAITYLGTQVRPGDSFGMVGDVLTLTLATPLPAGPTTIPAGTYTGASALMQWVNFSDFSIMSPPVGTIADPSGNVHDAVSAILMASVGNHYIAGDGRANENMGLTAVHHVFHEEHNFQIENLKQSIAKLDEREAALDSTNTYDHLLLNEWQVNTGVRNTDGHFVYANGDIAWNDDMLFNAAKMTVEMEYQHTAVDQFARTITPNLHEFVGYNSGEDATIALNFAQVAYRFGHSTLRESIDIMDPEGSITGSIMRVALERAFLSPEKFAAVGAGAIALGMTHQQANEIDEFVTPALNQGLLGMPLDLATINIARGRDLGVPTLNDMREALQLTRYTSWADFGANMLHPDSVANFIAAYAFDGNVELAQAIVGLANDSIAEGSPEAMGYTVQQAVDFMNNTDPLLYGAGAFNQIDCWIGGLAEVHVTGGLLGETFDTIFVDQLGRLMDGDRMYYLQRLNNIPYGQEIIDEQFKDLIERTTGVEHLNGSAFAYADQYFDLAGQEVADAKTEHKYGDALAANPTLGVYSEGGATTALNGNIITVNGVQYVRDVRTPSADTKAGNAAGFGLDGAPNSGADSNEVLVGTDRNDLVFMRGGDDTAYGEAGNDIINGGNGIDRLYGGDGADTILGGDGGDLIDGGNGDDVLWGEQNATAAAGLDQLIGSAGNDYVDGGIGIDKLSGSAGDDVIFGGGDTDAFTHGGEGNDYIDGGIVGDLLWGDNGDDLIVGQADQDIVAGMEGDDILRPGPLSQSLTGGGDEVIGGDGRSDAGTDGKGVGFDLIDLSDWQAAPVGATVDFSTQANPLPAIDGAPQFPAWAQIEGAIGSRNNDTLLADANNNWLIGGSGNDAITGGAGNDLVVGDGVRLDSLIGTYNSAYNLYFDGASHRAFGYTDEAETTGLQRNFIQNNGLLDAVGWGDQKHFTEMLKTAMFKNLELGGNTVTQLWRNGVSQTTGESAGSMGDGGTAGTQDTAVFTGNRAEYTVEKVTFTTANQGTITAYKITDTVAGRDGTDVVVGVENFRFADGTLNEVMIQAPVITSDGGGATAARTVNENTTAVTTVLVNDANAPAQPLTFSISGGADAALFSISATGVLSFVNAPNFEAVGDAGGNNVYDVVVQVSDGVSVDTQALAVTVANVNEAGSGELHVASYTQTNTNATLTASNTLADPDVPALVPTYQWQQFTAGNWVNIAGAAGTGATLANRSNATLRVTSTYNDGFGTTTVVSPETVIVGTSGNNTLAGTTGADFQLGLNGNDTLQASAGNDVIDGGAGTDTYTLAGTTSAANVNLTAGTASSATTGNDTLIGIENVIGSDVDNVITDAVGANTLSGAGGNDTFVLMGDNARDVIAGGAGVDTADYSAASANLTVTLNGTAVVAGTGSTSALSDTVNSVENFTGGSGNDTVTGGTAANVLNGGAGNDTLSGMAGTDTLDGGTGIDRLTGGAGVDTLTGGGDADVFAYGAISESGVGAALRDMITDFVTGSDKLDFSAIDANTGTAGNGTFTLNVNAGAAFTGAGQLVYHYEGSGASAITVIEGNVNTNLATDFQVALIGHIAIQSGDIVL